MDLGVNTHSIFEELETLGIECVGHWHSLALSLPPCTVSAFHFGI
jgi:hypothetical protein